MATFLSALIIIVCVLLVLIVLVQNSKGGGLAAGFSSSAQVMGVRKTADFLEKATWTLAIALMVLVLASSAVEKNTTGASLRESELKDKINEAPAAKPMNAPAPAPAPANNAPAPLTPAPETK
jgi:preprotein translocase subunit SecG